MSYVDWSIKGPSYGNCNCAWGCPCQFSSLPTHGDCRAMVSMRIDEGHFGDVDISKLCWVNLYEWPGAVHEGSGVRQTIIDVRADEQQRQALLKILAGEETEPGSTVFHVYGTTIDKVHDPLFEPIEFSFDLEARKARVVVEGIVDSVGAPIRNPVTGEPQRAQVTLPNGFEYTTAEYGSGTTKADAAIKLDLADSYGQFAVLHLTQNGPVR